MFTSKFCGFRSHFGNKAKASDFAEENASISLSRAMPLLPTHFRRLENLTLHNLNAIWSLDFLREIKGLRSVRLFGLPRRVRVPETVREKVKEAEFLPL